MTGAEALAFPTMAAAAAPRAGGAVRLLQALAASLLAALCAQLEFHIPGTPVPLTGQSAGILFAGALLGSRWGAFAATLYLFEGALGLPVFAGGAAGAHHFAGPTGGYLLGFVPAAWITGRLAERGWDRTPETAALMMLAGSAAILGLGALGLARFLPMDRVLLAGILPFLPGDAVKAAAAAAALPLGWRAIGRRRRR